ncbi:hypothetical protein Tco_0425478 [Tanacetum coccineum]
MLSTCSGYGYTLYPDTDVIKICSSSSELECSSTSELECSSTSKSELSSYVSSYDESNSSDESGCLEKSVPGLMKMDEEEIYEDDNETDEQDDEIDEEAEDGKDDSDDELWSPLWIPEGSKIDLSYTKWSKYGEKDKPSISAPKPVNATIEFVDDTDFASDIPQMASNIVEHGLKLQKE